MTEQPLFVLGVRRSGTTLLRVMLDRNSAIAIPDESYFIPQLAHRHRGTPVDVDAFLDDVRRLSTLREWGLAGERRGRAAAAGDDAGGGDRGDLRRLRRAAGQGTLGRQDAALHAVPAAHRAHLSRRTLRPSRPGRPRCGALVPLRAPRDHDGRVGPSEGRRRLRPALADGGRGCAGTRPARRARPVSRAPLRGSRARFGRRARIACARSPASSSRPTCSTTSAAPIRPASRTSSASTSLRPPACATGAPSSTRPTRRHSRMRQESCSRRSATRRGAPAAPRARARLELGGYRATTTAWRGVGYVMQRSPLWRRRHPPLI